MRPCLEIWHKPNRNRDGKPSSLLQKALGIGRKPSFEEQTIADVKRAMSSPKMQERTMLARTVCELSSAMRQMEAHFFREMSSPKMRKRLRRKQEMSGLAERVLGKRRPLSPAGLAPLSANTCAKGRPGDARLLLQADGQPGGDRPSDDYREDIAEIVHCLGLGSETTLYALRHSSIVRQLLRGVPNRIIAATHDTSVAAIEKHYSKCIADHSDDLSRAALLDHKRPGGNNIVSIAGR